MVHYYDIKNRQLRGAKWVTLYHPDAHQIVHHDVQTYVRNWTRLTGDIRTGPEDDSLIILANLGLTDTMRLNDQTKRLLNRTKYGHHIMGRTWYGFNVVKFIKSFHPVFFKEVCFI